MMPPTILRLAGLPPALTCLDSDHTVYHVCMQSTALGIIERLGDAFKTNVMKGKEKIIETPLLLAVGAHQDLVVRKLIDKGMDVNQVSLVHQYMCHSMWLLTWHDGVTLTTHAA